MILNQKGENCQWIIWQEKKAENGKKIAIVTKPVKTKKVAFEEAGEPEVKRLKKPLRKLLRKQLKKLMKSSLLALLFIFP